MTQADLQMSFIRPELQQRLWRWREAIAGAVAVALGAWGAVLGTGGVTRAAGTVLAVVGLVVVLAGVQRARFRRGGRGPGVVQVDEGAVAYFGPREGGVVAIAALERVELDPSGQAGFWVLTTAENRSNPLRIPTDAANAEALFDVFSRLDGLDTGHMLSRLDESPGEAVTIWEAPLGVLRHRRLGRD